MGSWSSKLKRVEDVPTVRVSPSTAHDYILAHIKRHGSATAQTDAATGEKIGYDEIVRQSGTLANGLMARGLHEGQTAIILGENSIHYPWVMLAVMQTGAAAHLIDPNSKPLELEHALNISHPTLALVSLHVSQTNPEATAILRSFPGVRHVLVWGTGGTNVEGELGGDLPEGVALLDQVVFFSPAKDSCSPCMPSTPTVQTLLVHAVEGVPVPKSPSGDSVALILSSSGSTGLPKGVMLSHDNLLAALRMGRHDLPSLIKREDVMLGVSPYFHAFGGMLMLIAMCAGAPVVAMKSFSMEGLLSAVEEHNITVVHLVSSLVYSISKLPAAQLARLSRLRALWSGAAPISPLVQNAITARLPTVTLGHCYGMTETTFTTFCGEWRADKPGSPGVLSPNMECRIVDPETGKSDGSWRGEIRFRGPMVMKGYLNNPEATREAFDEEGWLRSGDLGFKDEDNYFYILDRIKDVLKYNGNQVCPSELEALLMTHPAVKEAAVIGEPHEFGEAPRALVILNEGHAVSEEELKTFVGIKVATHKHLRAGICFLTEPFPRTASGKLQRKKLRALIPPPTPTPTEPVPTSVHSMLAKKLGLSSSSPVAPASPTTPETPSPSSSVHTMLGKMRFSSAAAPVIPETPSPPVAVERLPQRLQARPSVSSATSLSTIMSESPIESPMSSSTLQGAMGIDPTEVPLPPSEPTSPLSLFSQGSADMELTSPAPSVIIEEGPK